MSNKAIPEETFEDYAKCTSTSGIMKQLDAKQDE